ncbi:MAG: Hsp70 family protein [Chloroflexi bacterium]|nr:Hsp70 family protein [Chloroflexota bacterium]
MEKNYNILSIDLGTTNTVIARWMGEEPIIVNLPGISTEQKPTGTPVIPSVLLSLDPGKDRWLTGSEALKQDHTRQNIIRSFKSALGQDGRRTVHYDNRKPVTARQAAQVFLKNVLDEYNGIFNPAKNRGKGLLSRIFPFGGKKEERVVITVPVGFYETYRNELEKILHGLGYHGIKFVDEPVAAAVGYGLRFKDERIVLVIDFGGGTLDLAAVRLTPKAGATGQAEVLAKQADSVGGDGIDYWLMHKMTEGNLEKRRRLQGLLKDACEKAKIRLSLEDRVEETVYDPETGANLSLKLTREEFENMLKENGLFRRMESLLDRVKYQLQGKGFSEEDIRDVLLVGGSTLIPSVREFLENRYSREKIRAGRPFEAVASGAAAFMAGGTVRDVLQHSYGVLTFKPLIPNTQDYVNIPGDDSHSIQLIFKRNTPYPAAREPVTYEVGMMEGSTQTEFALYIYEIGEKAREEFICDPHRGWIPISRPNIELLNEKNPALGRLSPPATKCEKRIEVTYSVDEDRWLRVTVRDIKYDKILMDNNTVVQLR